MRQNIQTDQNSTKAHWSPDQYQPRREYVYKFTSSGELRIYISFPFDWTPRDRRPCIVFFFGGGWEVGSVQHFSRHATYLASRGMVAACADYRIKSRHGSTPIESIEDAKSAVRWFRSHAVELGIDPDSIITSGGSAGGHLAACTALIEGLDAPGDELSVSARPNAMVLYNPVMRFSANFAASFSLSEETADRISPLLYVSEQTPPSIQFFGTEDKMLVDGERFVEACKATGVRAELQTAEGMGHAFFNRDPWFKRTLHATDIFLTSLGYVIGEPTVRVDA